MNIFFTKLFLFLIIIPFLQVNAQSIKNSKSNFTSISFSTGNNNNQIYFPPQLFPEVNWRISEEDSLKLGLMEDLNEWLQLYDSINPRLIPVINYKGLDTIKIIWYSRYLIAMKEPVLFNVKSNKEVYRFLWLRTFDKPIALTIENNLLDHKILLVIKVLNGTGGFGTEEILVHKRRKLSNRKWKKFKNLLYELNFWEQPSYDLSPVTLDGSKWILEGSLPDYYHVLQGASSDKVDEFYKTCFYLLKISNLKIPHNRIY